MEVPITKLAQPSEPLIDPDMETAGPFGKRVVPPTATPALLGRTVAAWPFIVKAADVSADSGGEAIKGKTLDIVAEPITRFRLDLYATGVPEIVIGSTPGCTVCPSTRIALGKEGTAAMA